MARRIYQITQDDIDTGRNVSGFYNPSRVSMKDHVLDTFKGGTVGQVLVRSGAGSLDFSWSDASAPAGNQPPVVASVVSLGSVANDGTLTVTPAQLLSTSTDADGDTLNIQNITATGGTLAVSGQNWVFTPAAGYVGNITLNYQVFDGTASAAASATISVTSPASQPIYDSTVVITGIQVN